MFGMSSIEAENAANSELLASFSTKSEGITNILIRSSSCAEVSFCDYNDLQQTMVRLIYILTAFKLTGFKANLSYFKYYFEFAAQCLSINSAWLGIESTDRLITPATPDKYLYKPFAS